MIFDSITWWVCEHSHVFENVSKDGSAVYILFKCIKICGRYKGVCKLH